MAQKKNPPPHKASARRREKILITGAGGYVGATIAAFLKGERKDEYEVVGFGHNAEIDKDIRDYAALSRAVKGAYAIVHAASPTKDTWCKEHPYEALQTIVIGSRNVRRVAEERKVPLVIHFSTQAVYSNFAKRPLPLREDMALLPDTFYGALKALAEGETRDLPAPRLRQAGKRQDTRYRTRIVIVRPANIYGIGAGVLRGNVVHAFAENARNGKSLTLNGGGKQRVDFVHVRDIARLIGLILGRPETSDRRQDVVNAGSGKPTAIKDIARIVSSEMRRHGKKVKIIFKKVPKDTIAADRWLSIAKARKHFDWVLEISLKQGIMEFLE